MQVNKNFTEQLRGTMYFYLNGHKKKLKHVNIK